MFSSIYRQFNRNARVHDEEKQTVKAPVPVPEHVVKTEALSVVKYLYWERYNHILLSGGMTRGGYHSYTHKKMHQFGLKKYINAEYESLLQLGVSTGKFMSEQPASWRRIGYDFVQSVEPSSGIQFRLIDLNTIDRRGEEPVLSYIDQLQNDLQQPTTILAIRILEYLTPEAFKLLIFALMDAKPRTVFVLVGRAAKQQPDTESNPQAADQQPAKRADKHYTATFFATRTDMRIRLHIKANADEDEVLVVEKIERNAGYARSQCRL